MVYKCKQLSEEISKLDNPEKWSPPNLGLEKKSHGFLIVPKHPRAIAQEQESRRIEEEKAKAKEKVEGDESTVKNEADIKESYNQGFSDAKESLEKEYEEKLKLMHQEVHSQKEKISSLIEALDHSLADYESKVEKNIRNIALLLFNSDKKSHIEYIDQNIKKHLKSHKIYKIYISSESLSDWEKFLPEYKDLFSAQSNLNELECVINFDDFFLDGRLEALLRNNQSVEEER